MAKMGIILAKTGGDRRKRAWVLASIAEGILNDPTPDVTNENMTKSRLTGSKHMAGVVSIALFKLSLLDRLFNVSLPKFGADLDDLQIIRQRFGNHVDFNVQTQDRSWVAAMHRLSSAKVVRLIEERHCRPLPTK